MRLVRPLSVGVMATAASWALDVTGLSISAGGNEPSSLALPLLVLAIVLVVNLIRNRHKHT